MPLYRDVQGTGPWDRLKKVVMAGLVMRATGPFLFSYNCDAILYVLVLEQIIP